MKSIILVLSPKESCNLLNGDLSVLVRKKFPKDFVGWVYIYCTKDNKQVLCYVPATETFYCYLKDNIVAKQCDRMGLTFNGKVIARFWCDKVEEIYAYPTEIGCPYQTNTLPFKFLMQKSCLNSHDFNKYLKCKKGTAIHITKLEIFDEPKELSEFYKVGYGNIKPQGDLRDKIVAYYNDALKYQLTCAPRSGWCYVEV